MYLTKTRNYVVDNGISLVAIDASTGKVCGAALAFDSQAHWDHAIWESFDTRQDELDIKTAFPLVDDYDRIFEVLEEDLKKEVEQFAARNGLKSKHGICLSMWAGSVHKDYHERGIASTMIKTALNLSKKKGFLIAKSVCTNFFAAKAYSKIGAKIEKTVKYEDCHSLQGSVGNVHTSANLLVFRNFDERRFKNEFIYKL